MIHFICYTDVRRIETHRVYHWLFTIRRLCLLDTPRFYLNRLPDELGVFETEHILEGHRNVIDCFRLQLGVSACVEFVMLLK